MANDARMNLAVGAIRGAMANLHVALQLIGEIRAGEQQAQPDQADPNRPAMFGGVRTPNTEGAER